MCVCVTLEGVLNTEKVIQSLDFQSDLEGKYMIVLGRGTAEGDNGLSSVSRRLC